MQLPSVDIVIAAHNEERHLEACLNALRAQDYPDNRLNIYLVDDGSDDRTAEIARGCGVNLLQQPRRGAAAARNLGIAAGRGELLGLLDAHCYTQKDWVRVLAEQFADPKLGGCQATINNKSTNKRVQRYLDSSGTHSNERVLTDTVKGERNLYPWILSGNSMYRRSALEEAGLFNEELVACEDVDLAWRVVLLGYHLRHVPQVETTHYDHNSWLGFVKKGFRYGAGAAQLAQIYKLHGARAKHSLSGPLTSSLERSLSGFCYWAGFNMKVLRMSCGLDSRPLTLPLQPLLERFRAIQPWNEDRRLRVSATTVYWFKDPDSSIIVNVRAKKRIVLRTTGNFIWRRICAGLNREQVAEQLSKHYNVSIVTAISDLDDFLEELIDEGVVDEIALSKVDPILAGVT